MDFLTTNRTAPPPISWEWFGVMMFVMVGLMALTVRYQGSRSYSRLFKGLQAFQLLSLYAWYIVYAIPLSNSLPLYHCRLAMLAVLFLPDRTSYKQYFALLGLSGAIFALVYPVFDPYDFPHITSFSFLLDHYALLVNSLLYLLKHYQAELLGKRNILLYTMGMNALLVGVNQLTGGNYGLLKTTPIFNRHDLLFNYLVVTSVLSLALLLGNAFFQRFTRKGDRS